MKLAALGKLRLCFRNRRINGVGFRCVAQICDGSNLWHKSASFVHYYSTIMRRLQALFYGLLAEQNRHVGEGRTVVLEELVAQIGLLGIVV